ncbi:hypothetical protein FACS189468_4400 [Spirochaetia bacterium]|nr:hypothetical protein FACS189468_4400 [Spirochaetia bacterium]
MDPVVEKLIRNKVLEELARSGMGYVPAAVSARHVHLCKKDIEALFGKGSSLTVFKNLSQPGQFAAEEQVEIAGPKGSIEKVRVLGPERDATQVEVSISDCFALGVKPVVRMSGNTAGSSPCILKGPAGTLELTEGLIVAARHLHISVEQAAVYGLKNDDNIAVRVSSARPALLGDVVVRCGADHDLELHLDTDEANGNRISDGDLLEVWTGGSLIPASGGGFYTNAMGHRSVKNAAPSTPAAAGPAVTPLGLITEKTVNEAEGFGTRGGRPLESPIMGNKCWGGGKCVPPLNDYGIWIIKPGRRRVGIRLFLPGAF